MTNLEKYQYALAKLMLDTQTFGVSKTTGNIGACGDIKCHDCIFSNCGLCTCYQKAKAWANKEYKEPILDNVEREYLRGVIKPFRKRVMYIKKTNVWTGRERIWIHYDSTCMPLPLFNEKTMYKGMELNKAYTLKELGI